MKKLTVNETEENAYKLGQKAKEAELIFAYEKEHGDNRSAMFGGDILLSADIFEELSNYMQTQTDAPSPQEIKVGSLFIAQSSFESFKRFLKLPANGKFLSCAWLP